MNRTTGLYHRLSRTLASQHGDKSPVGSRQPLWLRAIRPVLWRLMMACLLSLLAPPTIAAFGPEPTSGSSAEQQQVTESATQVIFPSRSFAAPPTFAPPQNMLPVDAAEQNSWPARVSPASSYPDSLMPIVAAPQFPRATADNSIRLIGFQQASAVGPEPVGAGSPMVYGNPWSQMVHEDTGAPDLNAISGQPTYAPPPTCAPPDVSGHYDCDPNAWTWQVMPRGIIYQSYLAGTKEPRLASYFNNSSFGAFANATPEEPFTGVLHNMWDVTLGARVGIWRYGNDDPDWPEGWQLDIEGGVFPRLDPGGFSTPLIGDDYRFGIPLTYGGDKWEFKMGYYHVSAHVGDEYLLYVNPLFNRINYVRDSAVLGAGYFVTPSFRTYAEIGVAAVDGGAKPVEMQFGCEWVQAHNTGFRGGPFAAINGDLRQEVAYGGNVNIQFGWMWRQFARGSNFRIGGDYFYGKDDEYEFFNQTVSRIGWGIWYDF